MRTRLTPLALLTSSALVAVVVAVPGARPAAAANCSPYPPNPPVMTLRTNTLVLVAGQAVFGKGRLTRNGCGLAAKFVQVQRTTSGGSYVIARSQYTDAFGAYALRASPEVNVSLRGTFGGDPDFQSATSPTRIVWVRAKVLAAYSAPGACRLRAAGKIFPARRGTAVYLQLRRTRAGVFVGWSNLVGGRTDAGGRYVLTRRVTCGSRSDVSVFVQKTATNANNRTPTRRGIVARR